MTDIKLINYRVGQRLYTVFVDVAGTCSMGKYVVRTIRAGRVFAILYAKDITWVKKSKKHGDFGWAANIPECCRRSAPIGQQLYYLHTTKLQAWRRALKELDYYCDSPEALKRARRTLRARAKHK